MEISLMNLKHLCSPFVAVTMLLSLSACADRQQPAGIVSAESAVGQDLLPVFARAHQGKPLRYVAIGGSITQAGEGWIGPWLRQQFPISQITLINSGMSATGSSLGIFRAERDIIAHQPDLVAIEYCVNDGGLSDEDAVRFNESIVVRLKSLPNPPAIIFIEAAAQTGVNLQRHRKVAQHYGLVDVDTQKAVDDQLKKINKPWTEFFSDAVHPNKAGHAFYSQVIAEKLQPYVDQARNASPVTKSVHLPTQLSPKPLLLDAYMAPLVGVRQPGWSVEKNLPSWWARFFQGALAAKEPETTLTLTFRGTTVALFYALHQDYGTFYANVDGHQPKHVIANSRGGYTSSIIEQDLTPGEHTLTVVLPPVSAPTATPVNGPVKLGYLMVAGASTPATKTVAPQGPFTAEVLKKMTFKPIAAADWSYATPFVFDNPAAIDAKDVMAKAPSLEHLPKTNWQSVPAGPTPWVDIRKLTSSDKPGIIYARTVIQSDREYTTLLGLAADYYLVAKLNGKQIALFDGPHGGAQSQIFFPVILKKGENELLLKVGAGSAGFGFSATIGSPTPFSKP